MFNYSKAGVKNIEVYNRIYKGFVEWCKTIIKHGTFSTYCDGEPVCFSDGNEITYRMYQSAIN